MRAIRSIIVVFSFITSAAAATVSEWCRDNSTDAVCAKQAEWGCDQTGEYITDCNCSKVVDAEHDFAKFFAVKGHVPGVEMTIFSECNSDGVYDWIKVEAAAAATAPPGDPIHALAELLKQADKEIQDAALALDNKVKAERELKGRICDAFGVCLDPLDYLLLGGTATWSNEGWLLGGMALVHIPLGYSRSGMEVGATGGYGGWYKVSEGPRRAVVFRTQLGMVVQGVVMPWDRLGFVLGAQGDHYIPSEERAATDAVFLRTGLRAYLKWWLAVEAVALTGAVKHSGDWTGASGVQGSLLLHF